MQVNSTRPQERSEKNITGAEAILSIIGTIGILIIILVPNPEVENTSLPSTKIYVDASGDGVEEAPVTKSFADLPEDPYPGKWINPLSHVYPNQSRGPHGRNGESVDLIVWTGSKVFAVARGKVIRAVHEGWGGGYGLHVIILHRDGRQTLYGHLSEVNVSEGDLVFQAQVIGLSGSTGDSTGPHLHFEVRDGNNPLYALFDEE